MYWIIIILCFSNLNTTNLAYLSIKQALADVEAFIKDRSQNKLRNSKLVLFGGSYPGSLAAWARSTYPHLVHAAVSSSSVIKTRIDNIGINYCLLLYYYNNALFDILQQLNIIHIINFKFLWHNIVFKKVVKVL